MVSPNINQPTVLTGDRGIVGTPDVVEVRTPALTAAPDRVRWAPIVAGVVCCAAVLSLLSVLGTAIGITAWNPNDPNIGNGARVGMAIWGVITGLIAFFIGGYIGSSTASLTGTRFGLLHGALVWAACITLMLLFLGGGLVSMLGGGAVHMFNTSATLARDTLLTPRGGVLTPANQGPTIAAAWATFISMLLSLGAALVGGYLGAFRGLLDIRRDVVVGTTTTTMP